jgi:hypothetical protein
MKEMPPGWKPKSAYADDVRKKMSTADLSSPVTWGELVDLLGMLIENNRALATNILELQATTKEIGARQTLKYLGVWNAEKVYAAGSFVTDHGSTWHAQRASAGERPGTGESWVLAVKAGRPGKDAR